LLIGIDGMTFLFVLIQSIWLNDNHHYDYFRVYLLIIYTKASKRLYLYTYWKSRVLPSVHTKKTNKTEREKETKSIIQVQLQYTCMFIYCHSLFRQYRLLFYAYYNNRLWLMRVRKERTFLSFSCDDVLISTQIRTNNYNTKRSELIDSSPSNQYLILRREKKTARNNSLSSSNYRPLEDWFRRKSRSTLNINIYIREREIEDKRKWRNFENEHIFSMHRLQRDQCCDVRFNEIWRERDKSRRNRFILKHD